MSLSIVSLRIADPETRKQIKQGLEATASEFSGEWSVSVIDSPDNDAWAIKLTSPSGLRHIRMLSGPHQHSIQAVQTALRELRELQNYRPGGKEKIDLAIADLRELGHSVRAIINTDGRMWFEIDREKDGSMLASWEEMLRVADGLSLEKLEAIYVKRRDEELRTQGQRSSTTVAREPNLISRAPFLTALHLDGFLSFAPGSEPVQLTPLNLLIGPNGSGKSNFIEALELLRAIPTRFATAISDGGGAREWLWKGDGANGAANMEALVTRIPVSGRISALRYRLSFGASGQRTEVTDEAIEEAKKRRPSEPDVFFYYRFQRGHPVINVREITNVNEATGEAARENIKRYLQRQDLPPDESVLSQRKDPDIYPELTWLGQQFESIQMFRDWSFGRYAQLRQPQPADLPGDSLLPDSRNLAAVLHKLEYTDGAREFHRLLKSLLPRYERYSTRVESGTMQLYLHEQGLKAPVPATRLSDGTLRFMAILALLLSPKPKPLICIEEPELGLHPDALPLLATLMVEASKRTQLVVTTHSDTLVSALTEETESVMVCEYRGGTTLQRLDSSKLRYWLDKYRLGEIWRIGEIGGNL
jgi:predicted ATPase